MSPFLFSLSAILLTLNELDCYQPAYHWKEYRGVIPEDAYPAGRDVNGNNIYIGQGYVHGRGLFVGQITPGRANISVVDNNVIIMVDKYIKILCGARETFRWLRTNNINFNNDVVKKQLMVIGGYDNINGSMSIGRMVLKGETTIGKINTGTQDFNMKVADHYFPKVRSIRSYEVLIFNRLLWGAEYSTGYYWRDYVNIIPNDAISAGENSNGENIYIGQGYVHNHGIIAGQINYGISTITVAQHGFKKLHDNIKILCGFERNFSWVPTSESDLHLDTLDKNLVIGGHEYDPHYGPIHIGRIKIGQGYHVGKINSYAPLYSQIFYFDETINNETMADSFEILVYNP